MAIFKPFRAVRPKPEYAEAVAALPYDVMDSDEARAAVAGNPLSFLYVDKAEIDLPLGTHLYSPEVYQKAKENLKKLREKNICAKDEKPHFYIYRQIMNGRSQTGVVGCAGALDYIEGRIKRHELTRADKELDRTTHVDVCDANTGPIFLIYKQNKELSDLIKSFTESSQPVYDFVSDDGVGQTVWVVEDDALNAAIEAAFAKMEALYIADGHHRAASAVSVAKKRRAQHPDCTGEEEFNRFLAVAFPQDELEIMDYNRLLTDLNGLGEAEFLEKVREKFVLEETGGSSPYKPSRRHTFGMLCGGKWYRLTAKQGTYDESDPVGRLDVSILQNNLLAPVLGIGDPRTDNRIDFVGGIRGLDELVRRVENGMALAFSMYPTSIEELLSIADAEKIMPPKSTWFEPKLLSGLFVHELESEN